MTRPPALLLGALLVGGCGDDDVVIADGSPDYDAPVVITPDAPLPDAAPPPDGPTPDAFVLCPGELAFTDAVRDWVTGTPIFQATLEVSGDPTQSTTSAPNGRAVLCLAPGQDVDVQFGHADYVGLLHAVDAVAQTREVRFARMIKPADLDALFSGELELSREIEAAQVIVDVRGYFPDGEPLLGAEVAIDAPHQGAFTPGTGGVLAPGATLIEGSFVLFANAIGGATAVTVTPPANWECAGRETILLTPGLVFTAWTCVLP